MIEDKKPNYDYGIFFRVKKGISDSELRDKITIVKNSVTGYAELRDFTIAFDGEPEFCTSGYTPGNSLFRMRMQPINESDSLDARVKMYEPSHFLSVSKLSMDAPDKKVAELAIMLYDQIGPGGQHLLDDMVMYFKDRDRFLTV